MVGSTVNGTGLPALKSHSSSGCQGIAQHLTHLDMRNKVACIER